MNTTSATTRSTTISTTTITTTTISPTTTSINGNDSRPKWGWHLNISVTPSDFRPLPHPFVFYAPWTGGSFMSLGLGQPWPCLDLLPLLPLFFGIAFHLQLVLLSYHPIFLRPYHFLKLVSFLGANRTTSASVCLWMLRGAI